MGMTPSAHLAYGYDLGSDEDFRAAERDEYGGPKLPWLPDEDGEGGYDGFPEGADALLLAATGFVDPPWEEIEGDEEKVTTYFAEKREAEASHGVELHHSGHSDYSGWVLIAKGSKRSVEWSEAMELDLSELNNSPAYHGWDDKLAAALKVLGVTPTQAGPKWLVYPSYG